MEWKGTVVAVCISEAKGTEKQAVASAELAAGHGLVGDAHAGDWHRQVCLLSHDKVEAFRARGADVDNGAFGENILVAGIDLARLLPGTKIYIGASELEVTQIGKECHSHCRIHAQVGDCIMPREGIFARVLKGGTIAEGDEVRAEA